MTKKIDLFVYSDYTNQISALSPNEIYAAAKISGMDFVTITDRHTIDGCLEFLEAHPDTPDFIMGEEILCHFPNDHFSIPLGVYNINESQHKEMALLKQNGDELIAYLKSENIPHVVSHLFYNFPTDPPSPQTISMLLDLFQVFEVHHGRVITDHNTMFAYLIKTLPEKGICGASHARTTSHIGSTYTQANGETKEDILQDIMKGIASTKGEHGNLKQVFQEMLTTKAFRKGLKRWIALSAEKKKTPIYSALLGAALKSSCFIPKHLIE